MKLLLTSILILTSLSLYLTFSQNNQLQTEQVLDQEIFQKFQNWKQKFGKTYSNQNDDIYRFQIFTENYLYIEGFNSQEQEGNLKLAINQFSDLTLQEFQDKYFAKNKQLYDSPSIEDLESDILLKETVSDSEVNTYPDQLDWQREGAVNSPSDQGSCGSCWAFSAKEALEGTNAVQTNRLQQYSAQQLVDCSAQNYGCNGGFQNKALYYTQVKGIQSERSYPYESGRTGYRYTCIYSARDVEYQNKGYSLVQPKNQNAMLKYIQQQPMSITICAGNSTFQHYSSGIIVSCGCSTNDHAVLLTGYDKSGSTPYWYVMNSWGGSWGEHGYVYLAMNGNGPGACGVNKSVYFAY